MSINHTNINHPKNSISQENSYQHTQKKNFLATIIHTPFKTMEDYRFFIIKKKLKEKS